MEHLVDCLGKETANLNLLELRAEIVERNALRYTPAGIPIAELQLKHCSEQMEAQSVRQVELEVQAVAMGEIARIAMAAPMGSQLGFRGFLARRSRNSKTLVLHLVGIAASQDTE
jgi:primosomal replication protein N